MADKVDIVSAARFTINCTTGPVSSQPLEFSELSGILMEIDVVEFQDNNAQGHVQLHKLPGKAKPATITLKRPMNSMIGLWEWHSMIEVLHDYENARSDGTLVMHDYEGKAVAGYEFHGAWPSKISLGGLKAGASEVLVEEVTLTCEALRRLPKPPG